MFCRFGKWWLHEWSKWDQPPLLVSAGDVETKGTTKIIAVQQSTCAACNAIRYRQRVKWNVYT